MKRRGECGSVYRGKAIDGLTADQWERRGEVLHELRWCLCQRGRLGRGAVTGSVVLPHPECGENMALVTNGDSCQPYAFERVTQTTYVTVSGAKYRRGVKTYRNGQMIGRTGYHIPHIVESELPRLEAWAAKGGGK